MSCLNDLMLLFEKFKNWRVPLPSLGIPATEWIDLRKKVRGRFKGLFDPSKLANLTREDFNSFLNFKGKGSNLRLALVRLVSHARGGQAFQEIQNEEFK